MTAAPLPATDGLEERPSVVEQFDLSEDKEKSIIDQHNEQNLATKWEIWAYYACVTGALGVLRPLLILTIVITSEITAFHCSVSTWFLL